VWVTGWMCGELRPGEVGVKFVAAGGLRPKATRSFAKSRGSLGHLGGSNKMLISSFQN